jgi:hypothetical protein
MILAADRVMKARRSGGICDLCRKLILRGDPIAKYAAMRSWVHVSCAVRRCEVCHSRLSLTQIGEGRTSHPGCGTEVVS